ncbi:MAG: phosphotransferase [Actinobacteria bacterium]|nr:phosphotransferase [Actinomycetota bacterium]
MEPTLTPRPADPTPLTGRPTVGSIDELLAGVTHREPVKGSESLSTATFERVVIDGEHFIVKYLHCDDDWVMRATGDVSCRPVLMWTSGMFDALPPCLDHTVVNVASGLGRNGWGGALLMRDESEHFIPDEDAPIDVDDHLLFMENMAAFHAHFWGWRDTIGFTSAGNRWLLFNDHLAEIEEQLQSAATVPPLVAQGYANMAAYSPAAYRLTRDIFADPSAFLLAADQAPHTFVHSDWKLGNLGNHPDGRTILVDWAFQGEGPALADLAWYIGVNCRRIPQSKDDTIDAYRAALERHGIATGEWWDHQLALCLLGCFLQQGWSKTLSSRDSEYTWWEERALDAARNLA